MEKTICSKCRQYVQQAWEEDLQNPENDPKTYYIDSGGQSTCPDGSSHDPVVISDV